MATLLVVDDEQAICWGLQRLGERMGHEVITCSSAEQALAAARQHGPDVVVLDIRLPGLDGLAAMERLRAAAGPVPIIIITAYGDLSTAVEAVRNGAFEYLVKPFEVERVQAALQRALDRDQISGEPEAVSAVEGFVGTTPVMQEVFNQIALAAASDASVLLQGESGTGKELAARAIHKFSARAGRPFVVVNVAALSETVAESELFGHVRGAFTGADQDRPGLLQQAKGGTLFLDEIADVPRAIQVKLLRALENREVIPVGADRPVPTDFRVISATHQDLLELVRQGRFRHDLFFRISTFRILLAPLRQRRADIVPLSQYFLDQLARAGAPRCALSEEACRELQRRDWHGNVRELRNTIEHALIVARGTTIGPDHLPASMPSDVAAGGVPADLETRLATLLEQWAAQQLERPGPTGQLYDQLLALVEPPVLRAVFRSQAGQFASSARILGLHRTTLRRKADQYRLDREKGE